jgi:hypothetical protein
MANPTTPKLQVPQITRIRADNTHVADALQTIVDHINANVIPISGDGVTAPNTSTPSPARTKVVPPNALK